VDAYGHLGAKLLEDLRLRLASRLRRQPSGLLEGRDRDRRFLDGLGDMEAKRRFERL
jgi:hypothetical protein